ncbi:RUN and SH3 domain containing 1 [Cichlidogyrus casuarinus]|uniref:RUN and SH3 domain containing 1 n=1 Tax=Cichlidogyrus casuarinus TaxID=1844966 RepID=A0ABD2QJK1_9PLAT
MDPAEYYFDEDFSVPFDTNFQGDADLGDANSELYQNRYHSDPNLLNSSNDKLLLENQQRARMTSSKLGNMTISSADIDLEFSVGNSDFMASRLADRSDSSPQNMDYNAFSKSYMKILMNQSGYQELRDLLCKTDPDYAVNWSNVSAYRPELQRSISQTDVLGLRHAVNEAVTKKKSVAILARGTNTTTWADVRGSKESLKSHMQTNNKACGDSITLVPRKSKRVVDDVSCGWRAMKEAASHEFTTWGQLKRVAASARPSRQSDKHTDIFITSQLGDQVPPNVMGSFVRSRSQPSELGRNQVDMQRFSGTLLEIYMRARAMDENSINSSRFNPSEECHLRPAPISPSLQHISTNLPSRSRILNEPLSCETRDCTNFGAQFPPSDPDELRELNPNLRFPLWPGPLSRRFNAATHQVIT